MSLLSRLVPAAIVAAAFLAPGPAAAQEDYVAQANRLYANIRPGKRSDAVLLPLLAKMEQPPAAVSRVEDTMILPAGSAAWSAAEAWAQSAPQRAVLEALDTITREEDPVEAMAFGQPYGVEAMSSAEGVGLIRAGLYTDLGDPPMLAAARFLYLPALDRMACLVHVEATRRAAAKDPAGAIDLLIDWLFFARQMADRGFYTECRWGVRTMGGALGRVRDVTYVDFRFGGRELKPEQIASALERLRDQGGYLRIDRIVFPRADKLAAQQVIDRVFLPRQGPDPATFAATMSRLASTHRPLRLFSESARWEEAAAASADSFDQKEELNRVYDDWAARWSLRPFDPLLALQSQYERMNRTRYAVLEAVLEDMSTLINERDVLLAHLVGTRCALGLVAFHHRNRGFPKALAGIRPQYVKDLGVDPFSATGRDLGTGAPLEFFVPIRDTRERFGPRQTPTPHEINVFTPGGEFNFKAKVDQDQFVLYSVGPNGRKEWAENATGTPVRDSIGDLLLWPPVMSLYREEQQRTGRLK